MNETKLKEYHRERGARKHGAMKLTVNAHRGPRLTLVDEEPPFPRPITRADCKEGIRPCPWASCSMRLYLDVTARGGLTLNFPDMEPDELVETCALDVADEGGATLEEVGALMNVTRERVRQIEERAKSLLATNRTAKALAEAGLEFAEPRQEVT
jgi:hypothetical protein